MNTRCRSGHAQLPLALLLILSAPVSHAQGSSSDQEGAWLATYVDGTALGHPGTGTPENEQTVFVPPTTISDDGNGNELLPVTGQLIISATDASARNNMVLDILNEDGRVVEQHVLDASDGRQLWPVDVGGLAKGRYVARLSMGHSARMSRFRCD